MLEFHQRVRIYRLSRRYSLNRACQRSMQSLGYLKSCNPSYEEYRIYPKDRFNHIQWTLLSTKQSHVPLTFKEKRESKETEKEDSNKEGKIFHIGYQTRGRRCECKRGWMVEEKKKEKKKEMFHFSNEMASSMGGWLKDKSTANRSMLVRYVEYDSMSTILI